MQVKMYKLLDQYKWRMTKQQYQTIKGQIKKGEYQAAITGISRL